MTYRGQEVAPLDLTDLPAIVADFQAEGVEAVAICSPARLCQPRA